MATHSSVLAWRIPETEEPSGLSSMGVTQSWTRLKWLSSSSSSSHVSTLSDRPAGNWLASLRGLLIREQSARSMGWPRQLISHHPTHQLLLIYMAMVLFPGNKWKHTTEYCIWPTVWPEQVTNSAQHQRMGNTSHLFMGEDSKSCSISHGYEERRKIIANFVINLW